MLLHRMVLERLQHRRMRSFVKMFIHDSIKDINTLLCLTLTPFYGHFVSQLFVDNFISGEQKNLLSAGGLWDCDIF